MALWVQAGNNNLSTMTWYKGDEIENDVNLFWPFNQKGSNKGYMEIRSSSYPLYIYFTPLNVVKLQGIILGLYAGSSATNYDRDIKVVLEESTDGGSTWTSVNEKTLNFPNDVNAGPEKQYGKFIVDFRFDTPYSLNTSNQYRFKVYRVGSGSGTLYLQLSKNTSWSSWHSDVSDYAFRIIYSNTTGIPDSSDVFVITDELVIDQDWTVGYVTIPTSPTKDKLDSYNNKGSFWITSKGKLYIPSSITSDITVEVKGRMYLSGGDRVAWQIGDSEENPIPSDRVVNWYFNCEGSSRRAGIYGYRSSWTKIEHYGSSINKWYAVLKYDADKGTNQVVVEGDVTSEWQIGNKISIGGMKYSSTRHLNDFQRDHHFYEISSLSYDSGKDETTITLTENLAYIREATARVLLVKRNVNVYGNSVSSTNNMADTYIYYMRWWRAYWVRYSYMRYPAYFEGYNPKISTINYPHTDILKGILIHDCHYFYIRYRKGGQIEKIAACMERSSGWSWGDGGYVFYKSNNFTISEMIGITPYFTLEISQSSNNVVSDFWVQGQYGAYIYLASGNKIHDGTVFNSRYGILFSGSSRNEIYNIYMKHIYYDSTDLPTDTSVQGCFFYSGGMLSQDNYIHDITIENAFSIFIIDVDDGCADWYHNVVYSNITTEFYTVYRSDWLNDTRIRFTKRNGIENNDWIIYKYGEVHKTGDYENADDTLHRTDLNGKFALRLEPKVEGEEFKDYRILLTGAKKGKPVSYVGYVYVKSGYFDGDYELPEIYLEGCGIDCNSEPSAKWIHSGSNYADTWVSFTMVGTPQEDGNVYAVIKLKSNGSEPHFYIDDDIYTWAESIDWRGHEIWIEGQPSYPPAKFPVLTAMEIWEQPTNILTAENTIGKLVVDMDSEVENHRNTVEPKIDATISSRASQESVDVIPTNPLLDNDLRLDNLDATISSRLATNDSRLDNLDAKISSRSSHSPADVWNYTTRELTNPDNYKADVSDLAKESTVQAIKSQTDKLKFNEDNYIKSIAQNNELNNLDATVSSRASQDSVNSISNTLSTLVSDIWNYSTKTLTSFGSLVSDVWNYTTRTLTAGTKDDEIDAIKTQTDKLQFDANNNVLSNAQNSELSNLDVKVSDVKVNTDLIPEVKSKTDKLQFTAENDVKATLDGEEVILSNETEQQIDNIENQVTNPDQYKADVSDLAKEATVQSIKSQTDKLEFDEDNYIKSIAQNEELNNLDVMVSTRATQDSVNSITNVVTDIKTELTLHRQNTEETVEFIKQVESGRWVIKDNQMVFYKDDNVTEIMRFDLFDANGDPTMQTVMERKRI